MAFICAIMDTMSLSFLYSYFCSFLLDHYLRHHMLTLCNSIWLTQACGFHTCFLDFHRIGSHGCWGEGVLVERRDIFFFFVIFWITDNVLSYSLSGETPRPGGYLSCLCMSRCCKIASELVEALELISSGYNYGVSSSFSSWSWRLRSRVGASQGFFLAFEDLMPSRWFLLKCGHQNQENILRVGWWRPSEHFALSLRCGEVWDFKACFPYEFLWPDSLSFSCHWVG